MVAENTTENDPQMSALLAIPETVYDPSWYPDSGATNHLTPESGNLMGKQA